MSEFVDSAFYVAELLLFGLLPFISVTIAAIYIYKIGKAAQKTAGRFFGRMGK